MRIAILAVAVALAAGCGAPEAAAPPASQPTAAGTAAPPSPARSIDPACARPELAAFLKGVDEARKRGAFDVEGTAKLDWVDVGAWDVGLSAVEHDAQLPLYKTLVSAHESFRDYLTLDPDSVAARTAAISISYVALTLETQCHLGGGADHG
jgi:hypothetical protein